MGKRRIAVALVAGLAVLLMVLGVGWWQRRPIAAGFVDRALAERGVRGRYRIEAIGARVQRLADVSLGDPARPDLTARSVELRLAWGLAGPRVAAVTARGVRLRGSLTDGRLSFGAVDRLLPAGGGGGVTLPAIEVDVADATVALATPFGRVGLAVAGKGRLDDGFRGRLGVSVPSLAADGCTGEGVRASVAVMVARRVPRIDGPVSAVRVRCAGASVAGASVMGPGAVVHAVLTPALDGWSGTAEVSGGPVLRGAVSLASMSGTVSFAGGPARTEGSVRIAGRLLRAAPVSAAGMALAGRYAVGGVAAFDGEARVTGAVVDPGTLAAVPRLARAAAATPAGPVAAALAGATGRAARSFEASAAVMAGPAGVMVTRAAIVSASGARLRFDGRADVTGAIGTVAGGGGGLADVRVTLDRAGGVATIAPYQAGGARLALTPVRFAFVPGGLTVATRLTLDGPVAGGRVEGLAVALAARIDGAGVALRDRCLPVAAERILLAGFDFRAARTTACLTGGGAEIAALRLAGTSGAQPASLSVDGLRYAGGGFEVGPAVLAIGPPGGDTRLALAAASGRADAGGLAGEVSGLEGRIVAVPLVLSQGAGRWTLRGGALTLTGKARVADAAAPARFVPMTANDLRLTLVDGLIAAGATLRNPATGIAVSAVTIRHDLTAGAGSAVLEVAGLAFGDRLQPEALTPLTLGVVANVTGTVRGRGDIEWGPGGVTSTGLFSIDGIDLAAAFGPVTGIKGTIRFSDLLALATPPGQEVTIATANPGIAVIDGRVRYRLLPGQRVRIEGGRWPFAGGQLLLEPATIDFSRSTDRRLAFRIDGLDAARFVEQLAFENIAATGIFDGAMPMVFDGKGGRIEGGHLTARPGGGTVAYVGELTRAQLGVWGKLAFDALKSIRYRALTVSLDGALDGEIVSRVSFAGVNQEPIAGMKTPFQRELKGLPFVFNITLRAPFRGLLGSARSFADPGLLLRERLAVQPAASGVAP